MQEFTQWDALSEALEKYDMVEAYTKLLRLARSIRHLNEMHGLMPANCRLLRNIGGYCDLEHLKQAWQEMNPKGRTTLSASERPSRDEYRGQLAEACGLSNLTQYYADVINGMIGTKIIAILDPQRKYFITRRSCDTIHQHLAADWRPGGHFFRVKIADGVIADAAFLQSPGCLTEGGWSDQAQEEIRSTFGHQSESFWASFFQACIIAKMVFAPQELTEELTHLLLKLRDQDIVDVYFPRDQDIDHCGSGGEGMVWLVVKMPFSPFDAHLKKRATGSGFDRTSKIAQGTFEGEAVRQLRLMSIPVVEVKRQPTRQ